MKATAGAAWAVLLGGCLIVRTEQEVVDDPCPTAAPELLADATGPLVLGEDDLYFIGANGILSRVSPDGGAVYELTTSYVRALALAVDATGVYWVDDEAVAVKPFDAAPRVLASGYPGIRAIAVDDASVVWASTGGLDRWSKADQMIEHLDSAGPIIGLGAFGGQYYYSVYGTGTIRRTPPLQDLATAQSPGVLFVDEGGIYFYEVIDPFVDYSGSLRLVPLDGGSVVTTLKDLSLVDDITADDASVFFVTVYSSEYRVKQVSRFGGEVHTLACGVADVSLIHVEQRGDYVYWTDAHALYRVRKR